MDAVIVRVRVVVQQIGHLAGRALSILDRIASGGIRSAAQRRTAKRGTLDRANRSTANRDANRDAANGCITARAVQL